MSDYRESSNLAKDVRRGVIEIRPVGGKRKLTNADKPFIVEYRWTGRLLGPTDWRKSGRYETLAKANAAIEQQSRKHPSLFEYRLRPQEESA